MTAYLKAMRLGRWPRSLAIFVGSASFFLLNKHLFDFKNLPDLFYRAGFAFLLTWAISTANYIINEIVDVPYDKHHPQKQHRPLVTGLIQKAPLLISAVLISAASLILAYIHFPNRIFLLSLASLLLAGIFYNVKPFRTKDIPFLDSISESANNPIRFFIGWFAFCPSAIYPPVSLLICWWAFGNYLMAAKRVSEFRFLKDKAGDYRQSLKKYTRTSLILNMAVTTIVFFVMYTLFALDYKLQSFFFLLPLVFFYFYLIARKTFREKQVMEEPERLLYHFKFSLYTLLLVVAFFLSFLFDKIGQ